MSKILWLSDSPLIVTGYATISWNICNKLAEAGHEVFYIGHNYLGQDIPKGLTLKDGTKFNFTLLGGSPRPYSQDLLMPYIKKYKIDTFGILLDTFMTYPWIINIDFAPAKTIFYYPSDGGGGLPLGCENILKKVNYPVAMARFGQRQVKECYDLNTKYIPHAIDTKIYFPLSEEEKKNIKQKYGLQDKFVVGVVARNQGRKMLDRTIKTFALFAKGYKKCSCGLKYDILKNKCPIEFEYEERIKELEKNIKNLSPLFENERYTPLQEEMIIRQGNIRELENLKKELKEKKELKHDFTIVEGHPDAILFLHTDPYDCAAPFDIIQLINRYKLNNRVVFSGMTFYNGFDYKQMNEVYNLMDVFFLSTSGEGFGVPIIEAMACEVPVVATDYTTTRELLVEDGECGLVAPIASELTGSWNVERAIMDDSFASSRLDCLYRDKYLRKYLGQNGREKVNKFYNWDVVGKQWNDLIKEINK